MAPADITLKKLEMFIVPALPLAGGSHKKNKKKVRSRKRETLVFLSIASKYHA